MLLIVKYLYLPAEGFGKSPLYGIYGTVAHSIETLLPSVIRIHETHLCIKLAVSLIRQILNLEFSEVDGLFFVKILFPEFLHDHIRRNFSLLFGNRLYHIGKFPLHTLWKLESEICIHDKSNSALARLGIDTYNGLVFPSYIRRIYRKIRNLPYLVVPFLHGMHTLVYRILM